MGRTKKSKIEELKQAKENASEELRLSMLKGCEIAQALRELLQQLNKCRDAQKRVELKARIETVRLRHAEHSEAEKPLYKVKYDAAIAYSVAHRRLSEAERVLRVIKDPPPWGLGDYTIAQIAAFERQARKVVKELR